MVRDEAGNPKILLNKKVFHNFMAQNDVLVFYEIRN